MIQINILEPNDILKPYDYCRPLYITQGYEDCVMTRSLYSGTPCNNMKWTLVRNVFGECWWNQPIKNYFNGGHATHEFVRGYIPEEHILKD